MRPSSAARAAARVPASSEIRSGGAPTSAGDSEGGGSGGYVLIHVLPTVPREKSIRSRNQVLLDERGNPASPRHQWHRSALRYPGVDPRPKGQLHPHAPGLPEHPRNPLLPGYGQYDFQGIIDDNDVVQLLAVLSPQGRSRTGYNRSVFPAADVYEVHHSDLLWWAFCDVDDYACSYS
ncbi:MAG: hypothetical protein WCE81_00200 [Halobacteriota archaeon]